MTAPTITDVEFREATPTQNQPAESKTTCVSLLENTDPHQQLAADIKLEVIRAKAGAETAVAASIRVGELLLVAKEKVPHGQFQQWLTDHCDISIRHAQRYLQLAKKAKTIEVGDNTLVGAASVASAMRALTFSETDSPAKRIVYVGQKEPREKVQRALMQAWNGIKRIEKDFSLKRKVDCTQARKKLMAALETLNELEASQ